ncbi:MAG: hypothetical protein GC202_08680 [Alphaproteobacteria bacterium]|nr:hypothetical protein [Alphaproteobacteria bacterium]
MAEVLPNESAGSEKTDAKDAKAPSPGAELEAPVREAARPRTFEFAHKVFKVDKGIFRIDPTDDKPVYCVDLGDVRASLTFATLKHSFGIDEKHPDFAMLDEIKRALEIIPQIRPGDSIPSELLDGTASWKVEERHRTVARGRIWFALVAWVAGTKPSAKVDMQEFATLAQSPDARARVQSAFGQLAEKLGYPPERRADVVEQVERLIDEVSYIEALRERVGAARNVINTLKRFRQAFRRERTLAEEVDRTILLGEKPVIGLEQQLGAVDTRLGDTLAVLRELPQQVEFIRRTRDAIHAQMMKWDKLVAVWEGAGNAPGEETHKLVRETYRFVARHFPIASSWQR